MKQPAAFRGSYSDWRLVKTRAVVQVIFEVPLADADAAYEVLGGMPDYSKERWFGIAALKPEEARAKPDQDSPQKHSRPDRATREKMEWREVQPAAQAGIRCAEPMFRAFLREVKKFGHCDENDAAVAVRDICGVTSRSSLGVNQKARVIWHQLDTEYQAWLAKERVGA